MSRSFRTTDVLILPMSRRGTVDIDSAQLLDVDRLTAAGSVTVTPVVSDSGRVEVAVTAAPLADLTRGGRELLGPKVLAAREALAPRVEQLQETLETLAPKVTAAKEAAVERLAPAAEVTRDKLVPAAATARETVRETLNTTVTTAVETAAALREGRDGPAARSSRIPRPTLRRQSKVQTAASSPLPLLAGLLAMAVGVAVALRQRSAERYTSFSPEPATAGPRTAAADTATTEPATTEPAADGSRSAPAAAAAGDPVDGVDGVPHLGQSEQDTGSTS